MMHNLVGPIDDSYALFATSAGHNQYDVVIWPSAAAFAKQFRVSGAKLMKFIGKHWQTAERFGPNRLPDVFVHSLTADEIKLLSRPAVNRTLKAGRTRIPA